MNHNKDELIVDYVKDQLEEKMQASAMDINVACQNGVVQLTGMVDLLAEKIFAEGIARNIDGVVEIKNNLTIAMDSNITDKHIQKEVDMKLRNNSHQDVLLDVGSKVDDGIVHLLGHVDTLDEKKLAMKYASEARGVKEVISDIKLRTEDALDDSQIVSSIAGLYSATQIDPRDIDIVADKGTVMLKGYVMDSFQVEMASELAEGVDGVSRVINKLRVRK